MMKVVVQPTTEPVSIEEARAHLRLTPMGSPLAHPDDAYVEGCIAAAREWAEIYLSRSIALKTYVMALDTFSPSIELLAPVQSIVSVQYTDPDTLFLTPIPSSDYYADTFSEPGWLFPALGTDWPDTAAVVNSVRVTFEAGYTDGESPNDTPLPKPIKQAMLLLIGDMYENREASIVGTIYTSNPAVLSLLSMYRLGQGI